VSPSERLRRAKAAIRARARAARDAVPAHERATRSAAIARHLLAVPEIAAARTVMVFWSFGSEVHTAPIIDALLEGDRRVALPRVEDGDIVAVAYRPGDAMRETALGMREPAGGELVPPDELDAVVTPGLAFDAEGYRVGYGGGFFDRLFAKTRPDVRKAGVCFAAQIVERVPRGGHDVPVDIVVTERGVLRCG
jgi:5-formyltetrahydrofolate cyclo-ligase